MTSDIQNLSETHHDRQPSDLIRYLLDGYSRPQGWSDEPPYSETELDYYESIAWSYGYGIDRTPWSAQIDSMKHEILDFEWEWLENNHPDLLRYNKKTRSTCPFVEYALLIFIFSSLGAAFWGGIVSWLTGAWVPWAVAVAAVVGLATAIPSGYECWEDCTAIRKKVESFYGQYAPQPLRRDTPTGGVHAPIKRERTRSEADTFR